MTVPGPSQMEGTRTSAALGYVGFSRLEKGAVVVSGRGSLARGAGSSSAKRPRREGL